MNAGIRGDFVHFGSNEMWWDWMRECVGLSRYSTVVKLEVVLMMIAVACLNDEYLMRMSTLHS